MVSVRLFALLLVAGFSTACGDAEDARLISNCADSDTNDASEDAPSTPQYLFVQSAQSGSIMRTANDADIYILTLNDVDPTTTYFSDRPYRLSGYIETRDFVADWNNTDDDSFLKDPPNAALQLSDADEQADTLIVELLDVSYDETSQSLSYRIRLVKRAADSVELFHDRADSVDSIPADFGPVSLFVDSWYSKAWHEVKKTVSTASEKAQEAAKKAAEVVKKATADSEAALEKTAATLDKFAESPESMEDVTMDAWHQLTSSVIGIRACASAIPVLPRFEIVSTTDGNDRHDWMSRRDLGERTIGSLALPGSHDSGTYAINEAAPFTFELTQGGSGDFLPLGMVVTAITPYFPPTFPIMGGVADWSRAQRHTVFAQLSAGVRYLDLRIIADPLTGKLYATHGLRGESLDTIIDDVERFVKGNPHEILLLDFQHLFDSDGKEHGMPASVAEALAAKLIGTLGGQLVARRADGVFPSNMKVSELWQLEQQVIVGFDSEVHARLSDETKRLIWDADAIYSRYWPNELTWSAIESYLSANLPYANDPTLRKKPNDFRDESKLAAVLQGQFTAPSGMDGIKYVAKRIMLRLSIGSTLAQIDCLKKLSSPFGLLIARLESFSEKLVKLDHELSLELKAQTTNPQFVHWLEQNHPQHIIIADFIADYPALMDAIIANN